MYIRSQEGGRIINIKDVVYINLFFNGNYIVEAYLEPSTNGKCLTIATYSTKELAIKALDMYEENLEHYLNYEINKLSSTDIFLPNFIFRFPREENLTKKEDNTSCIFNN